MSITLVSFLLVCILFIIVIEAVRRGVLDIKYSLLWIFTCIVLGVLSLSKPLLEFLADLFGIAYAPSVLFLFGLLCTLVLIFDLTRRISGLNGKVELLTQEIALLKERHKKEIEELKNQIHKKDESE